MEKLEALESASTRTIRHHQSDTEMDSRDANLYPNSARTIVKKVAKEVSCAGVDVDNFLHSLTRNQQS
jgi:hypothetical protein